MKPKATGRGFVFHDPSGKRWPRFRRTLQTTGLIFGILLVIVIFAALTGPQLPVLGLPITAGAATIQTIFTGKEPRNVPYRPPRETKIKYVRSASPVMHPRAAARAVAGAPLVWGFYVNWDPGSIVSLRLHLAHLTHLVPEWLVLKNGEGDIDDQSDPTVITIAKQANLPILALLTNYRDGWRSNEIHRILTSPGRTADFIANTRANLEEHHFAGVNIDFEELNARDRAPLARFMQALTNDLHAHGYIVSEDVPVDDPAYDLKSLGNIVDYLVPMIYDEHYENGEPGPIASESFFENHLDRIAKLVKPEKVVAGLGAYGYDWEIGGRGSHEVTFGQVMAAGGTSHGSVEWDQTAENPVLRYDSGGVRHELWFLDAVTALNQTIAVGDEGFRGVGVWRLGAEEPGLWTVLKREAWPPDDFKGSQLNVLEADRQAPRHDGEGEILEVTETPHAGARDVANPPTPDGDYSERYTSYPSPYVVRHSGYSKEKLLCLTFDDGPDPAYTPHILDVLRAKHVPAAFFVVGENADAFSAIVRREYADGHEIGNHTYSHPNIATLSPFLQDQQLDATQRIIENMLGVSTVFFRPPYNADSEPQTPEELDPIVRAKRLGYATIAETIDPRDWEPGITAEKIENEIENEIGNGHIILLHDAGGNRNATVAALPHIIDRYLQRGYRFGLVSELAHKSRSDVMPRPSAEELRFAHIEGGAFDLEARLLQSLGVLFLCAIYLTMARSVIFAVLAILQKRRERRTHYDDAFRPPVSVLIAAFNEEAVIARTVDSLLRNDYEDMEIVIVDDGSRDRTLEVLRESYGDHPKVRILSQPNAGKSAALNNAIAHASHQVLVAVDADTLFRGGTIARLARHFKDPRTGAVSGNARVGNKRKWITRFQSIEYIYGFNLDRRALDYLNAITVVPGAVGAWRKDLVLEAGGFGHDTLAEDADLTLAIRRAGYVIRYEQDAIADTEAPEDGRSLAKQRFRWAFGTLQTAWKHRDTLFVPRYGTLGFVALPSIWIFQVLLGCLSPFAEICMAIALFAGNWKTVLAYYFAFFGVELVTGFLAYALEGVPAWDLAWLFFQRIYYRQLMLYVLLRSLLFAIRGRPVGWGKLERKASVAPIA